MPFVNRRWQLSRISTFVRDVQGGLPERHLALVGIRRIGKSRIIEHYLASPPPVIALTLQMDEATTTLPTFLKTVLRAGVNGVCRQSGVDPVPSTAGPVQVAAAAGRLGERMATLVSRALDLAGGRRPDPQQLFRAALAIPEELAVATGRPVVVFADEFQHLLDLSTYPPFRSGGGPTGAAARTNILKVFRAGVERRRDVGWVVTGSSVRLLRDILGTGPLMGRFDIIDVGPFDVKDTVRLGAAIWAESGTAGSDAALDRLYVLSGGNPFYADVAAREAAYDARALDREVTPDLVDRALLDAVHNPNGAISIACSEMRDSLNERVPAVRGLLLELARRGEATISELGHNVGLPADSLAWRHMNELDRMGFVAKVSEGRYRMVDPVFRYWLVAAANPLEQRPRLGDPDQVRKATARFEEAYLRERADRGHLVEGYVRDLVNNFAGQVIDGKRFGAPGTSVRLPVVTDVARVATNDREGRVFGYPAEVELDLCFGTAEIWLAEVRDRTKRATIADIELLATKSSFLRLALGLAPGPAWLISFGGMDAKGRARARELGIYVSGSSDINAIQAATGIRRQPDW